MSAQFFAQSSFDNPSGHGCAPKSAFSCSPADGEKLFDPLGFWAQGSRMSAGNPEEKLKVWASKGA